jgi:hypothetical protein
MSDRIRKLIQEKFGYTVNLPTVNQMHDDVTEGKKPQPSAHPLEEYRKVIKAVLGATTTEEDGILENAVDFTALHRLANKHGFAPAVMNQLNTIATEVKKPKAQRDSDLIISAWGEVKKFVPYWFIGLLSPKKEPLEDLDKKNITNLLKLMDKFNKESEKAGKELAKDTEHQSRDTQAKKNLDAARKDAKIDKEAVSEKKMKEDKSVEVEGHKSKAEEPKLPEDDSKKETPKEDKKEK